MASNQLVKQIISWQEEGQPLSIRKKTQTKLSSSKSLGSRFYLIPESDDVYFTYREMEIAMFLFQPLTYKVIGEQMGLSDRTVECHVRRMRIKIGCKDRFELVEQLIDLDVVCEFKEFYFRHNIVSIKQRGDTC